MSQVISWLNEIFQKGNYPFEVASSDPSIKVSDKKTKFPDVQIWLNRKAGQGFCGWELKTPRTPVDDPKLLEEASEKAQAMHADYFVTWNMRDAIIWRTPATGTKVTQEYRSHAYPSIDSVTTPEDLWVESKKILLKERAKQLLNDLSILYRDGHLHLVDIDATFFVHLLKEAAVTLGPHIHKALSHRVGRSSKFRDGLFDWAVKQGIQNYGDEAFYETVSRQIVYKTLGKILFYMTLRRFRADIPKMDLAGVKPTQTDRKLKEYFEKARQIDYQAVFEQDFLDQIALPASGVETLTKLISDLNRFNFSQMPQDVLGQVFEKLIPQEERHALGQYFTREELVDLINAFCVRSEDDKILDPTCGTGTFLIRAYDRKKILGEKKHKNLISHLWGIDIARFPAELATINLYRQDLNDYANFPRIDSRDFFEVKPNQVFEFPPPKPGLEPQPPVPEELPQFEGAVGNFPYIRQELIEKRDKGYKKKIERVIFDDWKDEYRELFDNGDMKLSGQADIYAYLFFHTARFLKEDGRMGIVTSNAWLDVAYGYELQKFFLKNFKIVAIIESRCEPWFEDPAVNTIVTILERCKNKQERENHLVKFVKLKKKLKGLIPWDMKLYAVNRWGGLDRLIYKIENTGRENFKLQNGKFVNSLKGVASYESDDFRTRVVKQNKLLNDLEEAGKTVKWGPYLRAPQVYFDILEKCKSKLVPIRKLAKIRRGYTTGINEFFHLTDDRIKHWDIEKEFLKPIVTSPKEIEEILIDPKNLELKVFVCHKSKKELLKEGKGQALKYIRWGEKQITKQKGRHKKGGVPFPEAPSVKGRTLWYDVGERTPGDFVINRFINERFFFPVNKAKVFLGDVVFEGQVTKRRQAEFYSAVMNSTLTFLFVELLGRAGLGEGLLTFYGPDIATLLLPDYHSVTPPLKKNITNTFHKLLTRKVEPISEEVKMKDRQKLDKLVLEALGLEPEKFLKPIYKGLCELVEERISLAKMRKNAKNARTKRDIERLKDQVMDELIPYGIKNFPEEFMDSIYLKQSKEISVPKEKMKLGHFFMGFQEIVADDGYKYQAKSLEEAKFIVYSQKLNSFIVKIPKSERALRKAVKDYERYVRSLKDKFFEAFFNRVLDHQLAERLTQTVIEELGLPQVADK
ncbi:MAG: SAM-dependent DNA methyltransferase [candidate division Zixibacteria bacterium]|nr:SAM-dependent DNA methyltransferase [candidate division Zixibacteria bacterium]